MFCQFLYKISAVILQNHNSSRIRIFEVGRDHLFQSSCCLCIIFSSCRWNVPEIGEGDPWKSASFLGHLSRNVSQRILSSRPMNNPKSAFVKSRAVIILFALLPSLSILNFIISQPLQSKLPPGLISINSLSMLANILIMLGSCHPHVPAAPCTAGVLVCCPPIWNSSLAQNSPECVERPYRHWVCRKALCWPMQGIQYHRQMQYTKHKSI